MSGGTTTYTYDALGSLKTVVLPGGKTVSYGMDGMGRRQSRKVNGIVRAYYLYEDALRVGAVLNVGGTITHRFIYGSKQNVPDYMIRGNAKFKLISDQNGSVRLVVRVSDGSILQRLDYDEFGNVLQDTNPGFQPFGFAGGLYDPDTKLVRFGVREYDPEVGRWLTKDPIGFAGGDTNLYGYVLQDPVNFVDPSGRSSFTAGVAGAILYGSLITSGVVTAPVLLGVTTGFAAGAAIYGLVNSFAPQATPAVNASSAVIIGVGAGASVPIAIAGILGTTASGSAITAGAFSGGVGALFLNAINGFSQITQSTVNDFNNCKK